LLDAQIYHNKFVLAGKWDKKKTERIKNNRAQTQSVITDGS